MHVNFAIFRQDAIDFFIRQRFQRIGATFTRAGAFELHILRIDLFHRQRLWLSDRFLRNALQCRYHVFHHRIAVKAGKKLRPGHGFQVIIKVFRTFHKVRQINCRERHAGP